MLSSCKIIKNKSIKENGRVKINTEYESEKEKFLREKNAKDFVESYESLVKNMIENARRQGDEIISSALNEAQSIEEEAYKRGYEKGEKEGFEAGMEKSNAVFSEMKEKIEKEAETSRENADAILLEAKNEYIRYLNEQQENIKKLIIDIIRNILKKEIQDEDSITNMVLDAMEIAQKSKTIIIRCNNKYTKDIKEKLEEWKIHNAYRGDTFVVSDENLEEGCAEIIKERGKIVVSVSQAFEKVKEIIEEDDTSD